MNHQEEAVLDHIRDFVSRNQRPVSAGEIMQFYGITDGRRLAKVLESLHRGRFIRQDPVLMNNWLPSEERVVFKASTLTEEKVRMAIEHFFKRTVHLPKPTDLQMEYDIMFGNSGYMDFQRELRRMVEKGAILRTRTFRYYFEGLVEESKEVTLINFAKK